MNESHKKFNAKMNGTMLKKNYRYLHFENKCFPYYNWYN